ncbi:MAG: aspartyl protease family protein [Bacteroidota bacterium]
MFTSRLLYRLSLAFLFIGIFKSASQGRFDIPGKQTDKIKFQLVNNLIIIPLELNGVQLSFLLDTGVSKPILFNITNTDSLQIKNVENIYLRGLGGGESVQALKSKKNFVKVGNAINVNQDIFVVFDQNIDFTPRLGVPVHGIIGYNIFRDFIVEINYKSKFIKLNEPETYTYKPCKKCETFDLAFFNKKPYINAKVQLKSEIKNVNLLIDTGSTDALWLFENDSLGLAPDESMQFDDFLGRGLSGNVYGKRSRIDAFELGNYRLEDVNTAFPDSSTTSYARKVENRSGSLSSEILKRFNLIVDYPNSKITIRKNSNFKSPFKYDRSGIVLEQKGLRVVREKFDRPTFDTYGRKNATNSTVLTNASYKYKLEPAYSIAEIRKESPAEKAGLLVGDVILSINGKSTHRMTLQEAIGFFQDKPSKTVKLLIDRNNKTKRFQLKLENPFKQKKLP